VNAVIRSGQQERQAQVICLRPVLQARVRLVCFAHAGATEAVFASWPDLLGGTLEVAAVRRPQLAAYQPLTQVLTEAVSAYVSRPPHLPYALFGQSLGCLLAFGVARQLRLLPGVQPCCLLGASASAPHLPVIQWPYPPPKEWTITDLATYLRDVGGTSESVLQNATSLQRLLPRMQVDLAVRASFIYTHEPPLDCPLAIFGGQQDASLSIDELAAWEAQTSAHCSVYRFPGGHFFLHEPATQRSFLWTLCCEVMRWLEDPAAVQASTRSQRKERNNHDRTR
jgi:medium-chain acyl-[acyl-carrier-protein] hydrolase